MGSGREATGRIARAEALRRGLGAARLAIAVAGVLTVKQVLAFPLLTHVRAVAPTTVLASLAVALLVAALSLQWHGRAQLVALAAGDALVTALHHANLVYFRQFSDLASVSSLAYAWQLGAVHGAVLDLVRARDVLLWLDVAILVAATAIPGARARARTSPSAAGWVGLAAVLLLVGCATRLERPQRGHLNAELTRADVATDLGLSGYFFYDVYSAVRRRFSGAPAISLGDAGRFYDARQRGSGPLTASARGMNVVVVQLESTQAFAVGLRVAGEPVTPELDRLAAESRVFTRFYSQAGQGRTSDAEFAAACSQLPPRSRPAFLSRADVEYRCLPQLLREHGYATVAMHANDPDFWNRARMYRALGYDRFLSVADFDPAPVIGFGLSDERFFEQAVERLVRTPQPFYALLVTLTCHPPFRFPGLPAALDVSGLPPDVGGYLNALHYADHALGQLVERLRKAGLLDRSVLLVYGDHQAVLARQAGAPFAPDASRGGAAFEFDRRVPLLVRLPGGAGRSVDAAPASQLDLAPTVLDALGIAGRTLFHGRSLLSDPPRPVVFADGSALDGTTAFLSKEQFSDPPGCYDVTGRRVADGRCDALARDARRESVVSGEMLERNLFRFLDRTRERPPPATE